MPRYDSLPREWRMPSREDFGRYVEANLGSVLRDMEKARWKALGRCLLGIPIVVPLAVAAFFIGTSFHANPELLSYAVATVSVILAIGWAYLFTRTYKKDYKAQLVFPLVRFFGADFEYAANAFVHSDRYRASGIFSSPFDRYSGRDHIAGSAGGTRVEFSEVRVERETLNADGSRHQWTRIFSGLFFVADFNQELLGSTWVFPDAIEAALGGWLAHKLQEWKIDRPGDLVTFEDPGFEKLFAVYASDSQEARNVLSPSLMRRLADQRRTVKHPFWIAFRHGVLYVAIARRSGLFDPKLLSAVGRKQCMAIFDDIAIGLGLIEELSLNPRIWSTQ